MFDFPHHFPRQPRRGLVLCLLLALTGCAVGPDFVKPAPKAPDDWTSWRSAEASLDGTGVTGQPLSPQWWLAFDDPVLDNLERRAFAASPDLQTAALHYAEARVQRISVAAQLFPEVDASGGVNRQRQSEHGASTRLYDALGSGAGSPISPAALTKVLSQPYNLYQAGFDASWEPDLWGKVRRSIEASDADVANQAAMLDMARLSLASDVARNYFELRSTQQQIGLARDDIAAVQEQVAILQAQVQAGVLDHRDLDRQHAELASVESQLPDLLAQEGVAVNQIARLLGELPGAMREVLQAPLGIVHAKLPDLALGLPSEVALRRPDIRSAEARLHNAIAGIGIARADLYPSIRLGAQFGYESYLKGDFSDWGSRNWTVGPTLNLPVFDFGRRVSVVHLRELQQQEAAVNYHQTVLKAWHEIDDALSSYTAEQQQARQLESRVSSTGDAYQLAKARYQAGTTDYISVLDSQRNYLQARRDLVASQGRLDTRYVTINKVVGNFPSQEQASGR
ncbi:efflux transporter outer membrane subunit [Frateuria aurantia]